jgi:hypothetical protein
MLPIIAEIVEMILVRFNRKASPSSTLSSTLSSKTTTSLP